MQIELNGNQYEDLRTVRQAVRAVTEADRGIAVAVNGEVVPRGEWARALDDGDKVEVLTATQGG
ncbi:sulfur carrier protein ThiS [Salininema proteolyticum]|uniref:Sulfur carrier protein ThiS n=1 Tax=Salininema proteolyticum TaxID=1607685 RepID=A0ABV8TSI5_9ACTN